MILGMLARFLSNHLLSTLHLGGSSGGLGLIVGDCLGHERGKRFKVKLCQFSEVEPRREVFAVALVGHLDYYDHTAQSCCTYGDAAMCATVHSLEPIFYSFTYKVAHKTHNPQITLRLGRSA